MKKYEEEYAKIVNSQPSWNYSTAEEEAGMIEKYSRLKDEDVHYGDLVYYSDKSLHTVSPKQQI